MSILLEVDWMIASRPAASELQPLRSQERKVYANPAIASLAIAATRFATRRRFFGRPQPLPIWQGSAFGDRLSAFTADG
jgi:hypothetical protein